MSSTSVAAAGAISGSGVSPGTPGGQEIAAEVSTGDISKNPRLDIRGWGTGVSTRTKVQKGLI